MIKLIKSYWLVLSYFAIVLTIISCNENTVDAKFYGSIKGTVTAAKDGLPLEGVLVSTTPGTETQLTGADGAFEFKDVEVKEEDYTVNFKKEGYTPLSVTVKVASDKTSNADAQMSIADDSGNRPGVPVYISPAYGTKNTNRTVKLEWHKVKEPKTDSIKYDIKLFIGNNDIIGRVVKENITDTVATIEGLDFDTAYEWQIIAKDENMDATEGPLWKFSTEPFPKNGYVFVRSNKNTGRDIYSWDLNKEHLVQLTNWNGDEVWPQISPNQRKIALASNESGKYYIYTIDTKGRNKTKITTAYTGVVTGNFETASGFCWSPAGDKILFVNGNTLNIVNEDGTGFQRLTTAPTSYDFKACDWTGNFGNKSEEKIVALIQGEKPYDNKIYIINPYTGAFEMELLGNVLGTLSNPHFSVDGAKVIYSWDTPNELDNGRQINAYIYSINIDGSENTKLSGSSSSGGNGGNTGGSDNKEGGTNDLQASFSELGDKIIFLNIANDGEGIKNIYTMNAKDGGSRSKIIENGEMPNWYNP